MTVEVHVDRVQCLVGKRGIVPHKICIRGETVVKGIHIGTLLAEPVGKVHIELLVAVAQATGDDVHVAQI